MNASDPSRIEDVLRPIRMVSFLGMSSGLASIAIADDAQAANHTIGVWALPLILVSIVLIGPYLVSIVAQASGTFPLLGVGAAHLGVLGFCVLVGLSVVAVRPLPVEAAAVVVVASIGALGVEAYGRRRGVR